MWVPAGEEPDGLDIEVIVPSECDNTSCTTGPDQPTYSHYGNTKDDGRQQPQKELTLSPHSYSRYTTHHKQHRKQLQKQSIPITEDQDDLGFVDLDESDREDSVLQIDVPDFSTCSNSTYRHYRSQSRSPRRAHSRSGYPISARHTPLIRQDTDSPASSGPQKTMRVFHRPSLFVPARYPVKFHKDAVKSSTKKARNAALKLPPSLNVKSRYGNQALLISSKVKRSALKQWPTPPIYPPKPKVRDSSVECHILRLVETLDIGTQNVPIMKTKQCQFGNIRKDTGTQYPRVRRKEIGLDPKENPTKSMGIQSVPETNNAMVETTVSVMYHPHIVITEDKGAQATVTYNKEYGWSHYGTDGSTQQEDDDADWESTHHVDSEKANPNLLGIPEPDYQKALENNFSQEDDIDKAYNDMEQNYDKDSFHSAPSEFSDVLSTTLNFGDHSDRSLQPVLETHRELVGLPDSGSEDGENDEDGEDEEIGERRDVLKGTSEMDRQLPPLSVCGRSTNSMSSIQVPVEDD